MQILKRTNCRGEQRPAIVLTAEDHARLHTLISESSTEETSSSAQFLREEIDRAVLIASEVAPSSLVMMGCEVKFLDHECTRVRRVKLVYPEEANKESRVSVLSALGSALIGLGPGQSIRWNDHGHERIVTVLEVYPSQ
jgi:regulator of nucleoside diphosphate kinase